MSPATLYVIVSIEAASCSLSSHHPLFPGACLIRQLLHVALWIFPNSFDQKLDGGYSQGERQLNKGGAELDPLRILIRLDSNQYKYFHLYSGYTVPKYA